MDNDIKIIDLELEDILGVKEVADELQIDYRVALSLMSQNVIKSICKRGYITKRELLERYKRQRAGIN